MVVGITEITETALLIRQLLNQFDDVFMINYLNEIVTLYKKAGIPLSHLSAYFSQKYLTSDSKWHIRSFKLNGNEGFLSIYFTIEIDKS